MPHTDKSDIQPPTSALTRCLLGLPPLLSRPVFRRALIGSLIVGYVVFKELELRWREEWEWWHVTPAHTGRRRPSQPPAI
jgi:hypothetical protein